MDFSHPHVMGIINLSPESFSKIARCLTLDAVLRQAEAIVMAGGAIIDLGAEPTNPSREQPVTPAEIELDRLLPAIEAIKKEFAIPLSVDTSKPSVMTACVAAGANMINDVRALREEGALEAAVGANVPVCLMHMLYPYGMTADNHEKIPYPQGVVTAVKAFLQERIHACLAAGLSRDQLIVDPGIGAGSFGKTTMENAILLQQLEVFSTFNLPLLVGISRKTFLGDIAHIPEADRLPASLAATVMAIERGARLIRTHDVKETVEAVAVAWHIMHSHERISDNAAA